MYYAKLRRKMWNVDPVTYLKSITGVAGLLNIVECLSDAQSPAQHHP